MEKNTMSVGIPNINRLASSLNLATTTRWIAIIPWQMINPNYKTMNVAFNLAQFEIPEILLGSEDVGVLGYNVEFPNYTIATSKELNFEYMLSSDFHQYSILWEWANKFVVEGGSGAPGDFPGLRNLLLPITIILISEFKNKVLEIKYTDCWIKRVGQLTMDYQDAEASNIKHSFTAVYQNFEFTVF